MSYIDLIDLHFCLKNDLTLKSMKLFPFSKENISILKYSSSFVEKEEIFFIVFTLKADKYHLLPLIYVI